MPRVIDLKLARARIRFRRKLKGREFMAFNPSGRPFFRISVNPADGILESLRGQVYRESIPKHANSSHFAR